MPELDLGNVMGPQGPQGNQGNDGPQGQQGIQGEAGKDASINGVNALQIEAGDGLEGSQDGNTYRMKLSAHAAQHATGGSDPITPESIGAAPGGYGLGGSSWNDRATTVADLNDAISNGWYQIASNALNTPPAFSNNYPDAGMLFVSAGGYTVYQRYLSYAPGGVPFYREAIRYAQISGGVYKFTDWEYVNPLLNSGFEYRTTERYQGKAVYKKLDTDNIIKWRIDGETEWKPEVQYTGAAAVLAINVPSRTVTVAASELAAYVAALPRLLTEDITINVGAGTCSDTLKISGFYGCGSITILGASDYGSVFSGGITILHCLIHVDIRGVSVSTNSKAVVSAATAAYVYLESCKIDGSSANYCVSAYEGAHLSLTSCSLINCSSGHAILCGHTSIAALNDCAMSGNNLGAYVYRGGIVLLAGSTPDTLGGSSNKKSGGLIVKANGTLL